MPSSELVVFVVAMEVLNAAGSELFRGGDSQAVEKARPWLLRGREHERTRAWRLRAEAAWVEGAADVGRVIGWGTLVGWATASAGECKHAFPEASSPTRQARTTSSPSQVLRSVAYLFFSLRRGEAANDREKEQVVEECKQKVSGDWKSETDDRAYCFGYEWLEILWLDVPGAVRPFQDRSSDGEHIRRQHTKKQEQNESEHHRKDDYKQATRTSQWAWHFQASRTSRRAWHFMQNEQRFLWSCHTPITVEMGNGMGMGLQGCENGREDRVSSDMCPQVISCQR
ncbi:uncharacterized protein [Triticum aestivum]|uniref:uncharacterized protein n=1 Tax=Triticum aestivum TaxID=4565 RepID=UPI001D0067B7|nr:uncharacterized protein LOC123153282 [Triticum aestivum]